MRAVYVVADNIFSPIGKDTRSNIAALKSGRTGIKLHEPSPAAPFYASLFEPDDVVPYPGLSRFEQILFYSAQDALKIYSPDLNSPRTGLIISSTKGNISLTENVSTTPTEEEIGLPGSAERVAEKLGIKQEPIVVSHACISGLLAMITGMRLIQAGLYDDIIVAGADLITDFILSGFQSFQAISLNPCRPFDKTRDGITLGEAAATVILSSKEKKGAIRLTGGAVSNDANHISGPSRTGEELALAIGSAMRQAEVNPGDIDFVSAHGTATRYNDDMEAKALHLSGLGSVPVNSLKGFYGHTLGAAGLIESIVSIHSLKEQLLFPTPGFSAPGTEKPVNVIQTLEQASIRKCLKTASGFGGCNAALVLENFN
ncbi:MAG TPA: beta-ketoacyl-[acyl-carrier-protein] synthase family protein [Puia sp.]|nr:beta-ketoacyl-[acyl-carrier-protein] synthase family protein [Puia sp.]